MQNQLIQQIFMNENILQDKYYKQNMQELEMAVWLKSIKKNNFPKSVRTFLHLVRENQLILVYTTQMNKIAAFLLSTDNMNIEERFTFSCDEQFYMDFNFLHHQSFLIQDHIYFIQNYNKFEQQHIIIADINRQKLLPIVNAHTKPHGFRIQYSLSLFSDYKMMMFGGLDEQMNLLNYLEVFDISTYEWEIKQTKGQPPSPRHSNLSMTNSQYLFIFGGSTCPSPFERDQGSLNDCYALDVKTFTWISVKMTSIPKSLFFGHLIQLTQTKYLYLHEVSQLWSIDLLVILDSNELKWESIKHPRAHMVTPEYRYMSSACLNIHKNQIYVYGGFSFNKIESQSQTTILDKLQLIKEGDGIKIENFEIYNDEKLTPGHFEQKKKQFLDEDHNFSLNENSDPEDEEDEEELTFEELLEKEKKLQEEEEELQKQQVNTKKKSQKKKRRNQK